MGTEVFTGVPNDLTASGGPLQTLQDTASSVKLRLEKTKYTFEQLTTWRLQIAALNLDGAMIYDANEGKNNVYLGIETQAQADTAKARIAKPSLPSDAVELQVVGPYDDLVLKGKELQEDIAQQQKKATEPSLETSAAVQYVDKSNAPLVGGIRMDIRGGTCTYGFSAKVNGVLGFISNSHCTSTIGVIDGDEVLQYGLPKIGYELIDWRARPCGVIWNSCRYSDTAFFKSTGARAAVPRIAGTGPEPGDKSYTYTSAIRGTLSAKQNEHYIAVTAKTGFTRLIVTNTCTYLRTYASPLTVECGAVAKPEAGYPNVQGGDSGSPVITRNGSDSVLVAEIFAKNPLAGSIWMNNINGIFRDFGGSSVLKYAW